MKEIRDVYLQIGQAQGLSMMYANMKRVYEAMPPETEVKMTAKDTVKLYTDVLTIMESFEKFLTWMVDEYEEETKK